MPTCSTCSGSGRVMDLGFQPCGGCGGSGLGGAGTCPYCGGSGTSSIPADRSCISCHGTGYIRDDPVTFDAPGTSKSRRHSRADPVVPPPLVQPDVEDYTGGKLLFRRHGHGQAKHKGGLVFNGRWSRGLWHGDGELTNAGQWSYEGRFKKGMLNGKGLLHLHDGTVFQGKFRGSSPYGKGTVQLPDGSKFEGKWHDCTTARGKYTSADGERYKAGIVGGDLVVKRGFFSKPRTITRIDFQEIFLS